MLAVLLVCTGNICRSPMAEGLLADRSTRLLGGAIRVRSAGTYARRANAPMPEAQQAARDLGVDISGLHSDPLDDEMVRSADIVLTMTTEQRDEVLGLVPEARERTFTLKEIVLLLAALPAPPRPATRETLLLRVAEAHELRERGTTPVADEDVSDPLGMSVETYRAVAWEIDSLVDGLVSGLFGGEREEKPEAAEIWGRG